MRKNRTQTNCDICNRNVEYTYGIEQLNVPHRRGSKLVRVCSEHKARVLEWNRYVREQRKELNNE